MNILFIAKNVTLAGRTGDSVHVRELCRELAQSGHKIVIIARDLQGFAESKYVEFHKPVSELTKDKRITIYSLRSKAKLSNPAVRDYLTLRRTFHALNRFEIHLIYSRSFNAYLEGFLSKMFQIPMVLEINGLELEERSALLGTRSYIGKNYLKRSSKLNFNYASRIIAVTRRIKDELHTEFGVPESKLSVIPNGVNEKMFKPDTSRNAVLQKKLELKRDSKVISFVGGFDPWHGVDLVARSAVEVVKREPGAVFLMVGDGARRTAVEAAVRKSGLSSNFRFTGTVPFEEVPHYINVSDICVIPFPATNTHLKDSSPLKLYEYLACGKPVVATDVGGVAEVIKASGGGVLVRPEDPAAMADGLVALLNDPKTRNAMKKKGRRYVVKNCTWKKTAENVINVCESVMDQK